MEKDVEFDRAPFGVVGLETAFAVANGQLVASGRMSLLDLVQRMSLAPARRFGIPGGKLETGQPASFAVLDPEERWQVRAQALRSRSKNSPFLGRTLRGRVVGTVFRGRLVYRLPGAAARQEETGDAAGDSRARRPAPPGTADGAFRGAVRSA
jgi:dihydroorotase